MVIKGVQNTPEPGEHSNSLWDGGCLHQPEGEGACQPKKLSSTIQTVVVYFCLRVYLILRYDFGFLPNPLVRNHFAIHIHKEGAQRVQPVAADQGHPELRDDVP